MKMLINKTVLPLALTLNVTELRSSHLMGRDMEFTQIGANTFVV